jgi:alpha-galactosidase
MGMKLMLWFEPERAFEGTMILDKHPEWFITMPNQKNSLLNLGNEEAKNYVKNLLVDYAKKYNLSCYRQDFNFIPSNWFEYGDEENRRGITEIKHILGMYEVWEHLLNSVPGIIIDNCASGGRRFDIETLKRSILFFRSDYQCAFNENPEVLQTHNTNSQAYFPYMGCTSKTKSDTYAIRSSYSSSWGGGFYNAIFQSMNEEDFIWASNITKEYLKIRKYFPLDYYNHGSSEFDDTSWSIWQFNDKDTNSGILMAFRRTNSPFDNVTLNLKGILKDKVYTAYNFDTNETFEFTNNLKVVLENKRSSVIIEYKLK